MSYTNTIYRIRQIDSLRRRWDKLCGDAKKFVLDEIKEDASEAAVARAIRKWRRSRRKDGPEGT